MELRLNLVSNSNATTHLLTLRDVVCKIDCDSLQIYISLNRTKTRVKSPKRSRGGKVAEKESETSNDIPCGSIEDTLPPVPGRVLQRIQIERSHARQQVHLMRLDEEAALISRVELPENVKPDDDGPGEIFLEESGRGGGSADGLG